MRARRPCLHTRFSHMWNDRLLVMRSLLIVNYVSFMCPHRMPDSCGSHFDFQQFEIATRVAVTLDNLQNHVISRICVCVYCECPFSVHDVSHWQQRKRDRNLRDSHRWRWTTGCSWRGKCNRRLGTIAESDGTSMDDAAIEEWDITTSMSEI